MTSALHKRLARLEELLAARVSPPIWKWMPQCVDTAAELDRMVADGEIAERDKGRVKIWRWLTREEALARGIEEPQPPPKPQPQLPASPERKLLPAPPKPADESYLQSTVEQQPQPPKPEEPAPPDHGKRGPLTEDQLRKLLEGRDRPFGRPIKYPRIPVA